MPAPRSIAPEDNGYTPIANRVLPMWAIAKTEASRTGKLRRRTLPVFMRATILLLLAQARALLANFIVRSDDGTPTGTNPDRVFKFFCDHLSRQSL